MTLAGRSSAGPRQTRKRSWGACTALGVLDPMCACDREAAPQPPPPAPSIKRCIVGTCGGHRHPTVIHSSLGSLVHELAPSHASSPRGTAHRLCAAAPRCRRLSGALRSPGSCAGSEAVAHQGQASVGRGRSAGESSCAERAGPQAAPRGAGRAWAGRNSPVLDLHHDGGLVEHVHGHGGGQHPLEGELHHGILVHRQLLDPAGRRRGARCRKGRRIGPQLGRRPGGRGRGFAACAVPGRPHPPGA